MGGGQDEVTQEDGEPPEEPVGLSLAEGTPLPTSSQRLWGPSWGRTWTLREARGRPHTGHRALG